MKKKIIIGFAIVLGLCAAGYLALPYLLASQKQAGSSYQTEAARVGSITAYVGATGSIRTNQTARLVWQASGKVTNVRVQKDQQVAVDTVLAELDPTSLAQNIITAQAELISAKEALDNALNNSVARTNAQLALIQAEKDLEDAEEESQSKLYQRASQETIDIARANLINANEALDSAEEVFNQTRAAGEDSPVYAAGLSQYARAKQEQQNAEYNLRYVQELPDALDVEEVDAKLEQAKARLLSAREDWDRIKDGPNPDDIAAAQARVDAAQATINQARLVAPFAGTITAVDAQQGDLVSTGILAFQIDDLSRLLVDVEVSEVDINHIQVGQTASLAFDAISGAEYHGAVTGIAANGSSTGGAVNFIVTVAIDDADEAIRPGMTAAVNIAVAQVDSALMVPNRAVRTENGKRVVYVLKTKAGEETAAPAAVEVTLGVSSNNYSQVIEGELKAGDRIVLNTPAEIQAMGSGMAPGSGLGKMLFGSNSTK